MPTPHFPRTPAQIRSGYDRRPVPATIDRALAATRVTLSADPDPQTMRDWQRHLDAGRIGVRAAATPPPGREFGCAALESILREPRR